MAKTASSSARSFALFCDGLYLPGGEGATIRFVQTARLLAAAGNDVTVIHAYRGWSDFRAMAREPYDVVLVHPDDYYAITGPVADLLRQRQFDWVQTKDPEVVASLRASGALPATTGLIFECHDAREPIAAAHAEYWAAAAADRAIALTEADAERLRAVQPDTTTIPVSIARADIRPRNHNGSGDAIAFLGNYFYGPNADAVRYICRDLLPLITAARPDAKVHFYGAAPQGLIDECRNPAAVFHGYVDDLVGTLRRADIALSAITAGTGFRVKVLHYAAAGLPVVGNALGVTGVGAHECFVVAEETRALAQACVDLLSDPARRSAQSAAQVALLRAEFTNETAAARYAHVLARERVSHDDLADGAWRSLAGHEPAWLAELVAQGRHPHLTDPRVRRGEALNLQRPVVRTLIAAREETARRSGEVIDGFAGLRRPGIASLAAA